MDKMFEPPLLTRNRVRSAYAVAVATDLVQLLLGPFGWMFADEILDVTAMILIGRLIGFHPLLLPTFALELLPVADLLPTWTGCVALVVALRRQQQRAVVSTTSAPQAQARGSSRTTPPWPAPGPVIDVDPLKRP